MRRWSKKTNIQGLSALNPLEPDRIVVAELVTQWRIPPEAGMRPNPLLCPIGRCYDQKKTIYERCFCVIKLVA